MCLNRHLLGLINCLNEPILIWTGFRGGCAVHSNKLFSWFLFIFLNKVRIWWTENEHTRSLFGLQKVGKIISKSFGKSMTPTEVASHTINNFSDEQSSNAHKVIKLLVLWWQSNFNDGCSCSRWYQAIRCERDVSNNSNDFRCSGSIEWGLVRFCSWMLRLDVASKMQYCGFGGKINFSVLAENVTFQFWQKT